MAPVPHDDASDPQNLEVTPAVSACDDQPLRHIGAHTAIVGNPEDTRMEVDGSGGAPEQAPQPTVATAALTSGTAHGPALPHWIDSDRVAWRPGDHEDLGRPPVPVASSPMAVEPTHTSQIRQWWQPSDSEPSVSSGDSH